MFIHNETDCPYLPDKNISVSCHDGNSSVGPFDSANIVADYELDANAAWILNIFTNCILINIICFFGIVGNSINIAVLRQHGFKETTNIILVSLSTSDLILSFLVPISRLKCIVSKFDEAFAISVHTFATLFVFMPKYACVGTSVAYVVVIAIERFLAVFCPFHVGKIFRKNVTIYILIALPLVCITSLAPSFFTLTYQWVYDSGFNRTVAILTYTDFYLNNQDFIDVYTWVGLNNFWCATSIVIVTSCCLAIGIKLTHAKMKRESMTRKATGYDTKVVKMLMTVCLVYLSVIIPAITLYSYYRPRFIIESTMALLVDDIGVILHSVNASMNFLVYVTMSEKFAATYRKLLSCRAVPRILGT